MATLVGLGNVEIYALITKVITNQEILSLLDFEDIIDIIPIRTSIVIMRKLLSILYQGVILLMKQQLFEFSLLHYLYMLSLHMVLRIY